jgi:hypothetical protein
MAQEPATPPFRIEDLPSIWNLTIEQSWIIEDLLPDACVCMLSGESGSGKSTVALALAHAVATGTPFLGRQCVQKPVLIVDKENGLPIYHERFKRLDIPETPNMLFWGNWFEPNPEGPDFKAIIDYAREYKPLIIFDSFVAFHPGNEQDATETRTYMEGYRRLAGVGATVIFIHHTGKGENTKDYRGSSDIKASVDVAYVLSAKKPLLALLELKPFKSREGVLDPIRISLEEAKFVVAADSFWPKIKEMIQQNPGKNQTELHTLLPDVYIHTLRRILKEAERKGDVTCTWVGHTCLYTIPPSP